MFFKKFKYLSASFLSLSLLATVNLSYALSPDPSRGAFCGDRYLYGVKTKEQFYQQINAASKKNLDEFNTFIDDQIEEIKKNNDDPNNIELLKAIERIQQSSPEFYRIGSSSNVDYIKKHGFEGDEDEKVFKTNQWQGNLEDKVASAHRCVFFSVGSTNNITASSPAYGDTLYTFDSDKIIKLHGWATLAEITEILTQLRYAGLNSDSGNFYFKSLKSGKLYTPLSRMNLKSMFRPLNQQESEVVKHNLYALKDLPNLSKDMAIFIILLERPKQSDHIGQSEYSVLLHKIISFPLDKDGNKDLWSLIIENAHKVNISFFDGLEIHTDYIPADNITAIRYLKSN